MMYTVIDLPAYLACPCIGRNLHLDTLFVMLVNLRDWKFSTPGDFSGHFHCA